ncbi:hypothetical protein FGG08_001978 [Glutinoglossum americanum]|uniref:Annexin n=1 Tax=Glutinoglossum americanum TaxID=1670608 RepID=A0A9P8L283_9PEZI|nr:hypothetical protein FGG08_001978 [Glutinoglossum americanum]
MSLSAHDSERRRGRSKSPGPRAKSPAARDRDRAPSPNPNVYGSKRYEYEYAQPTYNYAPPQAPEAPAMPTSPSSYSQGASMQFDGAPGYANPGQYQHAQVNAPYADQSQYQKRDSPPAAMQPYPPQGEYHNIPPQDRPPYAEPGHYQWAEVPQSPQGYEHPQSPQSAHPDRSLSLNASGGFNFNVGGGKPHSGSVSSPTVPQMPPYAQPTLPQYAQPQQYGYAQPPAPSSGRPEVVKVHSSGYPPPRPSHSPRPPSPSSTTGYASPSQYQYSQPERIQYNYKPAAKPVQYVNESSSSNVLTVRPGGGGGGGGGGGLGAPPSPGLHASMHRLSVSGGANISFGHGQAPPGSPLLEAYHGTYQSISPMPSPMMLATRPDDDLDGLDPLDESSDEDDEDDRRPGRRPTRRYDPESDAVDLVEALRHSKVDPEPLIEILPKLTDRQILDLRVEFKKHYKLQGQGVNVAKLIKSKLVPSAFGKACYATALGRWESEAYWANFWFQSNTSRRELLIETLFGRTNAEIREIKLAFKDKRYNDSLERCMKAELKADKFRMAVLLVLEENRQEESGVLYADSIRDDVRRLHEAIISEKGGETLMIQICVTRSDAQLREILKVYEQTYRKNFAREMLKRSTNLVGETLAHILNGIINAPVRDALLLHQAINESSKQAREELLISRLVRYHWDRTHLERIKVEFRSRYKRELAVAIAENTQGSFGLFMVELCRTR